MRVVTRLVFMSFLINEISTVKSESKAGPFRMYAVSVNVCNKTTLPLDEDPPIIFTLEVYNTTTKNNVMKGNVSVFRENWIFKPKVKSYVWSNDKWRLTYIVHDMGCNSLFTDLVFTTFNLKFNRAKCVIEKGEYYFENYDMNIFHHLATSKMEYGLTLWRIEVMSATTTYHCMEIVAAVVPA